MQQSLSSSSSSSSLLSRNILSSSLIWIMPQGAVKGCLPRSWAKFPPGQDLLLWQGNERYGSITKGLEHEKSLQNKPTVKSNSFGHIYTVGAMGSSCHSYVESFLFPCRCAANDITLQASKQFGRVKLPMWKKHAKDTRSATSIGHTVTRWVVSQKGLGRTLGVPG